MAGKFIVKAKQHIFENGEKVPFEVPMLPSVVPRFSNRVDVTNLFDKASFEGMSFKAFFANGKVFKGKLDEYGRTERIAAENNETVKVLIGDDGWHYVINYLGGDKTKPIYMKFVDNLGEPIANLEIKLTDDDLSELVVATTDSVGEVALPAIDYDYPILMVKKYEENEYKSIIRIDTEFTREITFISPKILVDLELMQEGETTGEYLRSYYNEEES